LLHSVAQPLVAGVAGQPQLLLSEARVMGEVPA
jgi:hypothetical protein